MPCHIYVEDTVFLSKTTRHPVLTEVHVPHAMIHLCRRVEHLGHGVLIWPLELRLDHSLSYSPYYTVYFNKIPLDDCVNLQQVKVSLSLP